MSVRGEPLAEAEVLASANGQLTAENLFAVPEIVISERQQESLRRLMAREATPGTARAGPRGGPAGISRRRRSPC